MSTKKDLYQRIKDVILNNTAIEHCRLYNSQFDEMDGENTFLFPCVFVEFAALDWINKNEGYQEAETTIRLHVGFESLETEELEILDILEAIHQSMQGLHDTSYFTPFSRVFEGQDTNHDNVIVWELNYNTLLSDNSGNRRHKLVKTTISDVCIEADTSTEATRPRM